jgi:hypothetical protein
LCPRFCFNFLFVVPSFAYYHTYIFFRNIDHLSCKRKKIILKNHYPNNNNNDSNNVLKEQFCKKIDNDNIINKNKCISKLNFGA